MTKPLSGDLPYLIRVGTGAALIIDAQESATRFGPAPVVEEQQRIVEFVPRAHALDVLSFRDPRQIGLARVEQTLHQRRHLDRRDAGRIAGRLWDVGRRVASDVELAPLLRLLDEAVQ